MIYNLLYPKSLLQLYHDPSIYNLGSVMIYWRIIPPRGGELGELRGEATASLSPRGDGELRAVCAVVDVVISKWVTSHKYLVGGFNPVKNMSSPVGMMTFPIWWESHNPFMFQSPPTRFPDTIGWHTKWLLPTDRTPHIQRGKYGLCGDVFTFDLHVVMLQLS